MTKIWHSFTAVPQSLLCSIFIFVMLGQTERWRINNLWSYLLKLFPWSNLLFFWLFFFKFCLYLSICLNICSLHEHAMHLIQLQAMKKDVNKERESKRARSFSIKRWADVEKQTERVEATLVLLLMKVWFVLFYFICSISPILSIL